MLNNKRTENVMQSHLYSMTDCYHESYQNVTESACSSYQMWQNTGMRQTDR